jgi:hypothetical protein
MAIEWGKCDEINIVFNSSTNTGECPDNPSDAIEIALNRRYINGRLNSLFLHNSAHNTVNISQTSFSFWVLYIAFTGTSFFFSLDVILNSGFFIL